MNTFETKLIETARDFPASEPLEVFDIARMRAERSENAPENAPGNNYTRVFDRFENGQPVFVWQNWGGV